MANASAIAGIAFANAFLGINHSLSHKLGGWFHIPHGTANALLFPFVCRFNAQRHPYKMGTFSQYQYPHTMARYAECARFCGINAGSDEEAVKKLIEKIEELKENPALADVPAIRDGRITSVTLCESFASSMTGDTIENFARSFHLDCFQ